MCDSSIFGAFSTRLGFLEIRAIEFCDTASVVGCVFELRGRETLNHTKRTSDAMGKFIQPEASSGVWPELRPDVRD